jgi:cytochrome c553
MKNWLIVGLIAMGMAAGGAQAAGDAAAGQARAAVCIACHGPDGNSPNPMWPKLAGQHPGYMVKQLKEFKSGARVEPLMIPMAAPLSEQDMENLAAFFASQKLVVGAADPNQVKLGESIYRGGVKATGVAACTACHGPSGVGNPGANFPRISGQHALYVDKALKAFRAGTRKNDPGGIMRNVAAKMTDAEIAAVAQYLQGLTM